jgi:Predicted permeases
MNLLYDDITIYIILFIVALFAAGIDAIAGGGGLLVVPTMLILGMNPLVTLGTNKLQSCFGTATSSYNYFKNGLLKENNIKLLAIISFVGSLIGTFLVSQLPNELLNNLIPILLIGAAIFLIINKGNKFNISKSVVLAFLPLVFLIGFYDGFFGPGTGTFFVMTFLIIKNRSIMQATAATKVLNLSSNFASFLVFQYKGFVIWELALIMAIAQVTGAYIGSKLAIKNGEKFVRPVIVFISIVLSLRILTS